ncbi:MAG: lipoyl(octanoyl) transferase LipB [Janthinobacterium lividum]
MTATVEWRVEPGLVDYPAAVATMEARVAAIRDKGAPELIWLVEHPPLYTAGTGAVAADLLDARFPVHSTGRGGRHTYHGPGQRVVYVMLDLERRGRDLRRFVAGLEQWAVAALGDFGIAAFAVPGRTGIWTDTAGGEAKIGAIGVRVRRWVTFHGVAINVAPDLDHFGGIVPCGLPDYAVTSIAAATGSTDLPRFDAALRRTMPMFLINLSPTNQDAMVLEDNDVSANVHLG